ncbi:MAG: adenosine kinase [Oligoflexales bacterium]
MKKYDVSAVCNALVDVLYQISQEQLDELKISKGMMTLADAETQKKLLGKLGAPDRCELGGSAMNAIRGLASLGSSTVFAGMVGRDDYGKTIHKRMEELNIKNNLGECDDATGTCIVLVTPDGERTMHTCLGASRLYTTANIPNEITDSKVFHFCGYQWDTDEQKSAIKKAIALAKENNTTTSFDVADPFVVQAHREDFKALIKDGADIVFANEEEAKLLYNLSPEDTAACIAETGATAVIKLGSKGAIIQKGSQKIKIDPVPTDVVDTTAAGDMFAAGFLWGFTQDRPLDECGRAAATLASDTIRQLGASLSSEVISTLKGS